MGTQAHIPSAIEVEETVKILTRLIANYAPAHMGLPRLNGVQVLLMLIDARDYLLGDYDTIRPQD